MKKFYDFLKQVFLGETGGLGSKTANMTVDQLVKVGTDMNVSIADAEKMINGFITKSEDKVLADITSSLADTKKLMSSDDMIEQELRIEYIDGKGADTMSFDEFKLSKKQSQEDLIGPEGFPPTAMSREQQIISSSNPGDEFGETLIDLGEPGGFTQMQKDNKLGQFATDSTNVSNYDELVKQGFYVEGTMKPGPSHPFNNPQKISEVTMANDGGPMTSKVVSNIASWKQDLIKSLDEGIITRAEYDEFYRNAQPIFDDEYAKVKQLDMQNGFVENTYDNRNADKLMMDYFPGENYAAKYTTDADIAATGYTPSESTVARNDESSNLIKRMIEEDLETTGKIIDSQSSEMRSYQALLEDARETGDIVEENRILDILENAKEQAVNDVPMSKIIFNDSKRSLNAMGGIIQGIKNRGK